MQEIKQLVTPKNYDKFDKKIADKEFLLAKFYDTTLSSLITPSCNANHKKFPKSKSQKLLDAQNKVYINIKDKSAEKQIENRNNIQVTHSYEMYLPLNRLWCRYMADLLAKQSNREARELKVLRSDFHGAQITVIHSKNPTMIGLQGIVVKQTLKTLEIMINPSPETGQISTLKPQTNSSKMLLKSICIFLLKTSEDTNFIINGNNLVYRPSDRIRHKFKFKKAETLNHEFMRILHKASKEEQDCEQN